jgi:hypothetical protein
MHRIFRNPDLLHKIFTFCKKAGARYQTDLVSLALANRTFCVAALPILWNHVHFVHPLLALLPNGIAEFEQRGRFQKLVSTYYSLNTGLFYLECRSELTSRTPNDYEWDRFEIYAAWIRMISYSDFQPCLGDLSGLFRSWANSRGGGLGPFGNPFYNLTHLYWKIHNKDEARNVCYLLSPNLVFLDIRTAQDVLEETDENDYGAELANMAKAIKRTCPSISDFALWHDDFGDPPMERLRAALCRTLKDILAFLPGLRCLRIDMAQLSVIIKVLPVMRSLEYLHLKGEDSKLTPFGVRSASSVFPALKKLSGCGEVQSMASLRFLLPVLSTTIDNLELHCDEQDPQYVITPPTLTKFLQDVSHFCATLRVIKIGPLHFHSQPARNILLPLTNCHDLRVLEIWAYSCARDVSCCLTDQNLSDMVRSWPSLEVFHIYNPWRSSNDTTSSSSPTLTLNAIKILCQSCSRLRSLCLTLDAETRPRTLHPFILHRGLLQSIDFGSSPISQPEMVAAWLGDVCPADGISCETYQRVAVAATKTHLRLRQKRKAMWDEVKRLLRTLQSSGGVSNQSTRRPVGRVANQRPFRIAPLSTRRWYAPYSSLNNLRLSKYLLFRLSPLRAVISDTSKKSISSSRVGK